MKIVSVMSVLLAATMSFGSEQESHHSKTFEITFTNLTHSIIFTPPVFSLSRDKIEVFETGEPASQGLEEVAEGGSTDTLAEELESEGVQDLVQTAAPVMPGASITVELEGSRRSRLNLASMLLPTNDGFVAMNGPRVWHRNRTKTFELRAYDAGTETNTETCVTIPGPQCGGEGFNEDGGEGFVVPHAGIHGESELSRMTYNWGEPVARITVRVVND